MSELKLLEKYNISIWSTKEELEDFYDILIKTEIRNQKSVQILLLIK